ncbi:mannitol dehydrogenase, partial [Erysipelatoclostridium ramosum]
QQSAVFVNTAIARMVIDGEENGHKFVKIADDYELVIAENELLDRKEHPIEGGLYTSHLQKYIERKLFIV